jgi:hypothetical protein
MKQESYKIEQIHPVATILPYPRYGDSNPYNFRVTVYFHGSSITKNTRTEQEALEFVQNNQTKLEPTWEEVTCNGRFSCE